MIDALDALPPLRDVIRRHGLTARKSLGQHFLLDLNLTARIARAAGGLAVGTTIEIGPGPGGLTRALLAHGAARVIAVERDNRCLAALEEISAVAEGRLEIVEGDALGIDVASLGDAPRRIVANLPYNIATPLVIGWLRRTDAIQSMTLMFQKEVAQRLTAGPGARAYGRLGVLANWRCATEYCFGVPASAFTPPPKVDSAVVKLVSYPEPRYPARFEAVERVTAAAFGKRRKMLRGALKALGDPAPLLAAADLDGSERAEDISVECFARMAAALDAG